MNFHSKWATALWIAAIALLPLRVANAHLHLCGDGQEAPVSVHVEDAPTHFDALDSASGHNDRDVELPAVQAFVKFESPDQLSLACIGQCTLIPFLPVIIDAAVPRFESSFDLSASFELRPPTRGPPR